MSVYDNNLMVYSNGQLVKAKNADTIKINNLSIASDTTAGTLTVGAVTVGTGGVTSTGALALTGTAVNVSGAADFNSSVSITGSVTIGGDLTVTGDITAKEQQNVLVSDSYLDLNFGNLNTASASPGGFTFNIKAVPSSQHTLTDFVAGVSGTSAPAFKVTGDHVADYSAGRIIQVSQSTSGSEDGLYAVAPDVGGNPAATYDAGTNKTTVPIYGTGGTAIPGYALFLQSNFVAATAENAKVVRVDLAVIGVSDGVHIKNSLEEAIGVGKLVTCYYADAQLSNFNNGWSLVGEGSIDLQDAYAVGNTIQLTNNKDLTVSKPTGGVNTAAISLGANKASDFTVTSAALTLATETTGDLNVSAASILDLDGASLTATFTGTAEIDAGGAITIESSAGAISIGADEISQAINIGTAGTRTVTVGSPTATLDFNSSSVTIDSSAAFSIDGGSASNVSTTSADLTVSTLSSGTLFLASAGEVDITAAANLDVNVTGSVTIDATTTVAIESSGGTLTLGGGAVNQNINIGTAGNRKVTIGATGGTTEVEINAGSGTVDINSSSITIDGTLASTFTVAGNSLTLATTTSGDLNVHSAGVLDLQGVSLAADFTSAVAIESSAGAISIGAINVAQNVNIGTGGTRAVSVGSSTAASVAVDGGTGYLTLSGDTGVRAADNLILDKAGGYLQAVTTEINAGMLLYVDSSGVGQKSDSNGSGTLEVEIVAIGSTTSVGDTIAVASVHGSVVFMKFVTGSVTRGHIAYLSDEAGLAQPFAANAGPTSGRVFRLGKILSGIPVAGLYPVLFMPQYVADL